MPFKMKGTAMYDKVKNDRGVSSMRLKSPMDKSPMDKSPMDKSPMDMGHSPKKMKSPMDMGHSPKKMKSPMDKSPMDSAHDRAVEGRGPNRAFIKKDSAMDMSHMKLKKDSAMDKSPMDHAHGAMNMSHMKLTQDAAMKMTSAMKKLSPMQANAFIGALNDARKKGAKTFEVDGKTYDVK